MNLNINWIELIIIGGFLYLIIKEAVKRAVFEVLTDNLNTRNIIANGIDEHIDRRSRPGMPS